MNASARKARRNVNDRRTNGRARRSTLRNAVKAVTEDKATVKGVTSALRTTAKKLRDTGELGEVKTRRCAVAEGVRDVKRWYTGRQIADIAAAYKPRKAEYKAVRAALIGA